MFKQNIVCGDCLKLMKYIESSSIDFILTDLPYGISPCSWDKRINLDLLWEQFKRIIKPKSAIVLTSVQPYTSILVISNLSEFRYEWIWDKTVGSNIFHVHTQPLKIHESVLVFCADVPYYYPIMVPKKKFQFQGRYNVVEDGTLVTNKSSKQNISNKTYTDSYPKSIVQFKKERRTRNSYHPTQKPVALFEYLIRTYTKEEALVLDPCAGSGTTGVAAINCKRNYILIEKEKGFYEIAKRRVEMQRIYRRR